jgi:hypothetical protein
MMKMTQDLHKWIREMQAGHNIVSRSFPALARSTKRKRRKQGKKLLRKYTWDAFDNQFDLSKIMDDKKIFLGVSDFEDLITVEIMKRRVDANLSTVQRETTVLCDRQRWSKWAEEQYSDCLFVQSNSSTGFIVEENTNNFIKFDVNSNSTTVRAFGDAEFAEDMVEIVESNFDVVTSYIEWIYGADGNSVNVPLNRDRLPTEEMYPFLNGESLNDYYDRYMESSANILLLIGPPGTGKTTFIRGLLAHRNCSAIVTYDAGILEKDAFFAKFIEDDAEEILMNYSLDKVAANFMTCTFQVKAEYQKRLEAIVHIDGSVRPQIVRKNEQPMIFELLQEIKLITGLGVCINTSFNLHEHPIANSPKDALNILKAGGIDYLISGELLLSQTK